MFFLHPWLALGKKKDGLKVIAGCLLKLNEVVVLFAALVSLTVKSMQPSHSGLVIELIKLFKIYPG